MNATPFESIALLTPRQVAEKIGVSVGTLAKHRCLRTNGIPFVRVGASVRYREDDVADYVASLPRHRTTSDGVAASTAQPA